MAQPIPSLDFMTAVKLAFARIKDMEGRSRRSEFWWFYLFSQLLGLVTCGIGGLVCFIPMMAVTVRRLHDTGRSGWWFFLFIILVFIISFVLNPIIVAGSATGRINLMDSSSTMVGIICACALVVIMSIILIVFYCTDSDQGENKYGPSPKYQ